jgi:chromosome segregation ATPase
VSTETRLAALEREADQRQTDIAQLHGRFDSLERRVDAFPAELTDRLDRRRKEVNRQIRDLRNELLQRAVSVVAPSTRGDTLKNIGLYVVLPIVLATLTGWFGILGSGVTK